MAQANNPANNPANNLANNQTLPRWLIALIVAVVAVALAALISYDWLSNHMKGLVLFGVVVYIVVFYLMRSLLLRFGSMVLLVLLWLVGPSFFGDIHLDLNPWMNVVLDIQKTSIPPATYQNLSILIIFFVALHYISNGYGRAFVAAVGMLAIGFIGFPSTGNQPSDTPPAELTPIAQSTTSTKTPATQLHNKLPAQNPLFTGREKELAELDQHFNREKTRIQAVHGGGGMGKTQVAIEYLHRHKSQYPLIWWVSAETVGKTTLSLAAHADQLQLPGKSLEQKAEATLHWLSEKESWLLVYDNAQTPQDLIGFLPPGDNGHILITSRHPDWNAIAHPITLISLPRPKAIELLWKRSERQGVDREGADALAALLGDFPLALVQAGAYLKQTGATFQDYINIYNDKGAKLFKDGPTPLYYQKTVDAVWDVSLQKLNQTLPEAVTLLDKLAFLDPDEVPLKLLKDKEIDDATFNKSIQALGKYSLITVTSGSLSIHRLLQDVIRARLKQQGKEKERLARDRSISFTVFSV